MSRHDVATLLIGVAFYAAGIWTALMWHRAHRTPTDPYLSEQETP